MGRSEKGREVKVRMNPPEIIETARLRLRQPAVEDAQAIFAEYAQDTEVTRYLTWKPSLFVDETRRHLELGLAAWREGKAFHWAVTGKEDNQFLGMVSLRVDGYKVELGYVLARAHWGRGYMTEAVRAVVDWALKQEGVYRVWAVCDVENRASARVLEKAGMTREGLLRRWSVHPNLSDEPRDCWCYAVTK